MHNFKSPETSRRVILELIKNIGRRKQQRGATSHPQGWGCALPPGRTPALWATWQAPDAHLLLYGVFWPGNNRKEATGTKRRRLEAELGQNQSRAPAEMFCQGNFPHGGGNHRDHHHQWSSHQEGVNLHHHLHQHHLLSNPSSSLVSNLCPKSSDWYLWVASSVDFSL